MAHGVQDLDDQETGDKLDCLFSWGANSYGQLGSGHREDKILPSQSKLPSSLAKKLKQITGGGGHTALLTDDGVVHVCGWNKNGQLGLTTQDAVEVTECCPVPSFPCPITKVSCGWNHTVALTESGAVFVWGSNAFGQLGEPSVHKQCFSPLQLPVEVFSCSKVCDIAAGLRHSLALTENGQVYSWGDGKKGQLGHGHKELCTQSSPKHVSDLDAVKDKCKSIAVGAYHSTAVSESGEVYAWGLNQHGQCGVCQPDKFSLRNKDLKLSPSNEWILNIYEPLRVEGLPPVSEVHCGWSHTIAVTTGGRKLFAWGRGDYGQLGRDIRTDGSATSSPATCCPLPTEITTLHSVIQVACGSEHVIVLTNDTEGLMTFGWNEHGMCGTGNETNVQIPFQISKPLEGWKVRLIGSGAGHCLVLAQSTKGLKP